MLWVDAQLRTSSTGCYTAAMLGFAVGTLTLGRMADKMGIVIPVVGSAVLLGIGFLLAGLAPNIVLLAATHLIIGFGAAGGFGPLLADISHWFVKRRGLAVVIVASGNYLGGTIWPLII